MALPRLLLRVKRERGQTRDPSRRILLVDGNLVLGELVATTLEGEGFAIIAGPASTDAVAVLSELRFDLVISDGCSRTAGAVLVSAAEPGGPDS